MLAEWYESKDGSVLYRTPLDNATNPTNLGILSFLGTFTHPQTIKEEINNSSLFGKIRQDKDVDKFVRLIVPYNQL